MQLENTVYDEAIKTIETSLEIAQKYNDKPTEVFILNTLGRIFLDKKELEKAKSQLDKSVEISKKLPNKRSLVINLNFE